MAAARIVENMLICALGPVRWIFVVGVGGW